MAYSQDIRRRVTKAVASGLSRRAAAARFMVSVSSAIRWVERAAREGTPVARKPGRPAGHGRLSDQLAFLIATVEADARYDDAGVGGAACRGARRHRPPGLALAAAVPGRDHI